MNLILVPVDFSECSENALRAAIVSARTTSAEVHLLHVIFTPPEADVLFTNAEDTSGKVYENEYVNSVSARAELEFERLKMLYADSGVLITSSILSGEVVKTIIRCAEENRADLIVAGVNGSGGVGEIFVGSNIEKIIRYAESPVLTVHAEQRDFSFKKIVFAGNLKEFAHIGFLENFIKLHGSDLQMLYVNTPINFQTTDVLEDRYAHFVDKYEFECDGFSIWCDFTEERGIQRFAEMKGADLIVMVTHQRRGLAHFIMGSMSEDVAAISKIPVLTLGLRKF